MTASGDIWSDWPELLQRVADACGGGVALSLAASYGGRELYVPHPDAIDEAHPLALTLGLATARTVADVLSPGKIVIPMGPTSSVRRRKAAMRAMRRAGRTNAEQARALGIHVRTVEIRHQRDRELGIDAAEDATPDLFGDR